MPVFPVDAITTRELKKVRVFIDWCHQFGVQGYIGEIGYPSGVSSAGTQPTPLEWMMPTRRVIEEARAAGMHITTFTSSGQGSQPGGFGGGYYWTGVHTKIDSVQPLTQYYEYEQRNSLPFFGTNVAGGDFGYGTSAATGSFSNLNPPAFPAQYSYPDSTSAAYMAGRGVNFVRYGIRWENLQPTLGAALSATEVARINVFLDACVTAGIRVLLDVHNYGAYYTDVSGTATRQPINNGVVTVAHWNDLWTRISTQWKAHAAVLGYDLMNEPLSMTVGTSPSFASAALHWEYLTQQAVTTIRANSDTKVIAVSLYQHHTELAYINHPNGAWITDSAKNTWYTAHQYCMTNANTASDYRTELAAERAAGTFDPTTRGSNAGVVSFDQRIRNSGDRY